MYLTYFDDTGGTGRNYSDPQQPVQGLCSVSIDEAIWRDVEHDCRLVVDEHFPEEADRFLASGAFELHASAIYQGSGAFRRKAFEERLRLLDDIVEVIIAHRLPVLGVYIDKKRAQEVLVKFLTMDDIDNVLFMMLYINLATHLSMSKGNERTIMIGDHDSIQPNDAEQFEHQVSRSEPGRHILESARFVDSHRSFGVQLADAAAYLLRRHITHPHRPIPAGSRLLNWLGGVQDEDKYGALWVAGGWQWK